MLVSNPPPHGRFDNSSLFPYIKPMFTFSGKHVAGLFALLVMVAVTSLSWAQDAPPTPMQKPVQKPAQDSESGGLLDFTATLLSFDKARDEDQSPTVAAIPLPQAKPEFAARVIPGPKTIATSTTALNDKDTALYADIFALQKEGQFQAADQKIKALKDLRLYGHVLHQRYMSAKGYISSFRELETWLAHYSDHPGARDIYALAQRKKPQNYKGRLEKPNTKIHLIRRREPTMVNAAHYTPSRTRDAAAQTALKVLNETLYDFIQNNQPSAALAALRDAAATLDPVEYDILRTRIAASYLYNGRSQDAFALASASAKRSGLHVPLAGWIGGLSAWLNEDFTAASLHFEIVGRSSYASGWTKSAGAYWAARSHMRRGDVKAVSAWLNRSAKYPRTFYGLIATRALGHDFDFNWAIPAFTKSHAKSLSKPQAGFRAMALVQAGETTRAEAELIRMDLSDEALREAVLSFAEYAHLPRLSMRLGSAYEAQESGRYYDAALYPIGPWPLAKKNGVDSALIHAVIRQESRFNPTAKSPSGAQGLMQIIPRTARAIGGDKADQLDNPQVNLEIGQKYLSVLLKDRAVRNELFHLLIAYNAGPGNLKKWQRRWPQIKDPLVFVELLPSAETRAYVERVLANYWIYRLRAGAPTPTLNAVTSGKTAKYAFIAHGTKTVLADNHDSE